MLLQRLEARLNREDGADAHNLEAFGEHYLADYPGLPPPGKEVRVVNKFNCAIDNVLYEDDFVRIDWVGLELQPSYVLKILPTGQGAFPDYVDTSITFVGGGASSVGNGDGANVINTKFYFNGSAILDPAFTHINYGSTSRGFLIAENDLNYPSYTLKIATGDVAFLGVAVVERY